jgi:hypothetical protein
MTEYTIYTAAERPDLIDATDKMNGNGWPEFMLHDSVANKHFWRLYDTFPEFQVILVNPQGEVIASGNTMPLTWDGTVDGLPDRGWDAAMETGMNNRAKGIPPNTVSAIQAVVSKAHLGTGLSSHVLRAMRENTARQGLGRLIAPVRPNLKHRYPLTSMKRYVEWQHTDGLPFDPWLRTHARLGARILKVCPLSMTITGKIADWEKWTEMRFPDSGQYIVPGALNPVEMNLESDVGTYIEPNVWMEHKVAIS